MEQKNAEMTAERIKDSYELSVPGWRDFDGPILRDAPIVRTYKILLREALDTLIEERAMRKKAEWLIEHGEGRCACLPRSDMRHGWADCHWLTAERKEIFG